MTVSREALSPAGPLIPREWAVLSLKAKTAGQRCLAPAPRQRYGRPQDRGASQEWDREECLCEVSALEGQRPGGSTLLTSTPW